MTHLAAFLAGVMVMNFAAFYLHGKTIESVRAEHDSQVIQAYADGVEVKLLPPPAL